MTHLSIIIVSYNTKDLTLACLKSIYEETQDISFEVLVVDNASQDDSATEIAENFPDVKLIKSDVNLGFAGANNLAAKQATGKYLLLLNPDTVVLDKAIQKLHAFAVAHPENLVYGGRTFFKDLSLNPTSCWKRPTLWSLFCYATGLVSIFRRNKLFDPESYGQWQRNTVREVDIVTGCFLLIKKTFWEKLKGFDPNFFMYGEDADLCLRAKALGAKPIINPAATIVHYCGASEKVRADKMIRLFRAKEQLVRRHWTPFFALFGIKMLRLSVLTRMLACRFFYLMGAKKFSEAAKNWNEIWHRRSEWQTIP
jgi:N-acetylglucosaminyl-diphospho-decaprenol L-rhamnosyltransferase